MKTKFFQNFKGGMVSRWDGSHPVGFIPLLAVYGCVRGTILIAFSTGHAAVQIAQPVQSSSMIFGIVPNPSN